MNLADLLGYADIHQLSQIAKSYGCECNGHSKHELIQTILTTVSRKQWLDRLIANMDIADIRFINSLLFDSKTGYSVEELTARATQARFAAPGQETDASREMIVDFKQRGWLFSGYSQQTRYLLQVPDDLKRKIERSLEKRLAQDIVITDEPAAYRDEHTLLADDILYFLRYTAKEELPLTMEGAIYKRNLHALLDGMAVKEAPLGRVGFRFGYGRRFRDYPDRFSFLYDYCYYQGLIREDDGILRLTENGIARVNGLNREDLGQIFRLWIRLYKGPIPNVLAIANWVIRLSSNWVSVRSLTACLSPLIKPFYYDSPETVLQQRIIHMLMHLGLLQIGEHQEHGTVVRANEAASRIVQRTSVKEEETIRLPMKAR